MSSSLAGKNVDPGLLPGVRDLRVRHFAKSEDAEGFRQTAEIWEKLNRADADSLYTAACMRAVTATVLRAADTSAEGAEQSDAEAERAVAWLKQAVAAGFNDAAHVAQDRGLDALREREEFQNRVAGLRGG